MLARCFGIWDLWRDYSRMRESYRLTGIEIEHREVCKLFRLDIKLEFPNLLRIRDLFSLTDSRKNLLEPKEDLFETNRLRRFNARIRRGNYNWSIEYLYTRKR